MRTATLTPAAIAKVVAARKAGHQVRFLAETQDDRAPVARWVDMEGAMDSYSTDVLLFADGGTARTSPHSDDMAAYAAAEMRKEADERDAHRGAR